MELICTHMQIVITSVLVGFTNTTLMDTITRREVLKLKPIDLLMHLVGCSFANKLKKTHG